MDQDDFVRLALVGFALVFCSFVVLGFSRLVVPLWVAHLLAAPLAITGTALMVYLFIRASLAAVGVWGIESREA